MQSKKSIFPIAISEEANFERLVSTKNREYIREFVLRDYITTNDYVDSLIIDCRLFEKKIFELKNKHAANALKFKILACTDPKFGWTEIKTETALAAATPTYEWDTEPWAYVKIQVKSSVADTPAKVDALIACQN